MPSKDAHSVIRLLQRHKKHSIPRSAVYWYYFKQRLLENANVRGIFDEKRFDRDQFKHELEQHARPSRFGPRFCRLKNAESRRRIINELVTVAYRYYRA